MRRKNMFDELLVRHCSPTLAGMKTGSIFTCSYTDTAEMRKDIRCFNRMLGKDSLIDIMPDPTVVTDILGGHLALLVRLEQYADTVADFIS